MKKHIDLHYAKSAGQKANLTLLSTSYKKETSNLKWKCNSCGNQFLKNLRQIERIPNSKCDFEIEANKIKCDKCRNDYIINYFNSLASQHVDSKTNRQGRLLSTEYKALNTDYEWECEFGHRWKTTANIIRRGFWCSHCYGNIKGSIEEMKQIGKDRGGKCLSSKYINSRSKLLWQCSLNHRWKATPNKIKKGRWCSKCSASLSERLVNICFNTIFNEPFNKEKPEWLKYKNIYLELDGYSEKLKLAFEHNGSQHYTRSFNMSKEKFEKRLFYDKWKVKKCKENNIKLIVIPPLFEFLPLEQLKNFIVFQCTEMNVELPPNIDDIEIDYNEAYKHPLNENKLKDIKKFAKSKNGKCLSKFYVNCYTKLKFECENGHIFWQKPNELGKCWCYECSTTRKKHIEEILEFAKKINLILLSKEYKNQNEDLEWKCPICNDSWMRSYKRMQRSYNGNNIQCRNKNCPNHKNDKEKENIKKQKEEKFKEIKEYAISRGFECLNKEYIDLNNHYIWKCKNIKNGKVCNHVWEARYISLKNRGCAKCSGNMKRELLEVKEAMLKENIFCMTNQYNNDQDLLKVKCLNCDKEWETTYSRFKEGLDRNCNCK